MKASSVFLHSYSLYPKAVRSSTNLSTLRFSLVIVLISSPTPFVGLVKKVLSLTPTARQFGDSPRMVRQRSGTRELRLNVQWASHPPDPLSWWLTQSSSRFSSLTWQPKKPSLACNQITSSRTCVRAINSASDRSPVTGISLRTEILCFFAETRRFASEATCYVRKPRDLTMRRVSKILSSSSASYVFYRKERSNAIF